MNPHNIDQTTHDQTDFAPLAQGEDTFFGQLDDEAIELALKTVSCNPRDMRQFLRSGALR
jgi:hypothetical protein